MGVLTHPTVDLDLAKRLKSLLLKRSGLALGLWGEAGVGKTHTAQALLRQTPCPSVSLHATTPPGRWPALLPKPKTLELWAERVLERAEHGDTANLPEALGALLAKLAPVVLHLEDLHEAQPEQVGFILELAHIARRSKGVGLLITSRGELPAPIEATRLEPLPPSGSRDLLQSHAGAELPAEATEWIFGRAAGNPLFTLEYFRHLSRMGNLWNDGRQWHWRVPQGQSMPLTVEALLEQQIQVVKGLPDCGKVIAARAILPLEADGEIWLRVTELPTPRFEKAQLQLRQFGILRGDAFGHPLFAEIARVSLTPAERKTLARAIIAASHSNAGLAAIFIEEAALEQSQAFELFSQAIAQAKHLGDAVGAARWSVKAVTYAPKEDQVALALAAAETLKGVNLGEAIAALESVSKTHSPTFVLAWKLAQLLATRGDIKEAEALLLPYAHQPNYFPCCMILRAVVQDYATTVQLWQNHPEVWADAEPEVLYQVAHSLNAVGNSQAAIQLTQKALTLPNLEPELRCKFLSALGGSHYYLAEFAKADACFAEANQIAREHGLKQAFANTAFNRAYAAWGNGDVELERSLLEQAIQGYSELGLTRRLCHSQIRMAEALKNRGEYAVAETLLQKSHETLLLQTLSETLADCEVGLSDLYLAWETPYSKALALKFAYDALKTSRQLNSQRNLLNGLMMVAQAEIGANKVVRGLELAHEGLNLAQALGQPWAIYACHLVLGQALIQLERLDEARVALEQAQKGMQELGMEGEVQTVGLELDRISYDQRAALQRLVWFEQRQMYNLAHRVRRYFPELVEVSSVKVTTEPSFRLEVLGPPQITQNGQTTAVRGRKRQELLALLLEARLSGRSEVSRLSLLEALYPDDDELKASAALKQLVSSLRENLGEAALQTTPSGYALGAVHSDAEDFLQNGDTALWRGAYLEGLSLESTVADSLYLALKLQAEAVVASDPKEAARLGRILLEADPYSLEYLQLCLSAYKAADNYKTIGRLYEQARERMKEVGEHLPPQWTEFVQQSG